MWKKVLPILIFILKICTVFDLNAQVVKNVASRIDGRSVIVSYDLIGDNPNAQCEVKIFFGNAIEQNELVENAEGDIGPDIEIGTNKQVSISNLAPLLPYQDDLTFRVEATYTFYSATIETTPLNANILINGINRGKTPASVNLQTGSNTIEISLENYETFSTDISPSKQNELFEFTLVKKSPVSVSTFPKKSNISVGGSSYSENDTIWISGNEIELNVEKNKFKSYNGSINVHEQERIQQVQILLEPIVYRTKGKAILYSLILPGMGQSYLKRGSWTPVMGLLGYGLLAGSVSKHNSAVESYDLYLEASDIADRASLNQQWQDEKNQSETFLYAAAAIWVGNLVWTLVSKDEATRYRMIKTQIKFDNVTNTGGISLIYPLNNRFEKEAIPH